MTITRLLLVDDEERFLKTTELLLAKKNCNVFTATDGIRAMQILYTEQIDVIILEVKMPGLDGVEVLRRIKAKYPMIEVIMLTGHSMAESAVEGLKTGAFDYLTKPCDVSVLLEKIKEAHDKKLRMEAKIRQVKIDKIISHPLEVFEKD